MSRKETRVYSYLPNNGCFLGFLDSRRVEPQSDAVAMEGGAPTPARMTTVSRHYFGGGASERDHDLRVDIIEAREPCEAASSSLPLPTRASDR